jgi:hypothetical protein
MWYTMKHVHIHYINWIILRSWLLTNQRRESHISIVGVGTDRHVVMPKPNASAE